MTELTITTVWYEGWTNDKNGNAVFMPVFAEQQEEYGVEFAMSPAKEHGLYRGLYVDVTGTEDSLRSWWVSGYNAENNGVEYHTEEFNSRLNNKLTKWGTVDFEYDHKDWDWRSFV